MDATNVINFKGDAPAQAVFLLLQQKHAYVHWLQRSWSTSLREVPPMEGLGEMVFSGDDQVWKTRIFKASDSLSSVSMNQYGGLTFQTCSVDGTSNAARIALAEAAIPKVELENVHRKRPISFWNMAPKGPSQRQRLIEIPSWAEIAQNYTADVREVLGAVVKNDFRPDGSGKLILWRGMPGTGKTFAIRSLTQEWREWADFHYIIDPDAFFGSTPEYMLSVITGSRDSDDDDPLEPTKATRWRILILEDAGELLAADAKQNTGQGLSRLLNLVDGFVGQGLSVIVLITTNEELGKLHPAVTRAGRCLMNLEFTPLTHAEIAAWSELHKLEKPPASGRIADLYASLNGSHHDRAPEPIGFAATL